MKYSDLITDWLSDLGYTHFFSVGGGNIMHLTESLSKKLICIPVVSEVAAGVAVEYFNETSSSSKALALVTAGPGLTNIVTAIAGAFLESRELLVIGGQAKTTDLSRGKVRQRGIQEIDGVAIVKSITVYSKLLDRVISAAEFAVMVSTCSTVRNGPVFLEIPLDVQAANVKLEKLNVKAIAGGRKTIKKIPSNSIFKVIDKFNKSARPVLLIGGGVNRETANELRSNLSALDCPVMTTWNGADRIPAQQENYMGRPNTWGQRSSNMILQQSDLLIALGTRLGLQQTGFNWQQFIPNGSIIQVDIDSLELEKGHPVVDLPLNGDANHFLHKFLSSKLHSHTEWLHYAKNIRKNIPLIEPVNAPHPNFVSPFALASTLSKLSGDGDIIIPCSSGSGFTTMMQSYEQKNNQKIVTNKGLASMGYGLSGAIGASIANPDKRVIVVEGDGGFSQNLQEIGTAAINNLNLKIFILDDSGYASIRTTQKNYFGGNYIGCDRKTGVGLPNWDLIFRAWGVIAIRIHPGYSSDANFLDLFNSNKMCVFIVTVDPEQKYFPKISSNITESGAMESRPLHLMTPDLSELEASLYLKYI
uniref:thiamine pyrophosphate-binding protein n=1 Tax=Fulvivirga sp. TaxID=1931237 RepID=UPI00404AC117